MAMADTNYLTGRGQRGVITQAAEDDRARLDQQLQASQAQQRAWFAQNPVKPNPPPGQAPAPQFGNEMQTAAEAIMPPEYRTPVTDTPGNAYVPPPPAPTINAQPMQRIAGAQPVQPFVGEAALKPRGPVESAVTSQSAPNTSIADANAAARVQLDAMAARDAQNQQSRDAALQQNANWANAWTAQRDAASAARVANFRATNGADMILRGGPGDENQQRAIVGQAAAANAQLAGADARLAASTQPPAQRNFIQEAATQQGTIESAAAGADARKTGAVNRQGAIIGQQTAQQKLEQEKRISDTSAKLLEAKTPEEREQLQQSILTMLGKDPRDGTKVLPLKMPSRTNEMGVVVDGGQGVVIIEPGKPPQIIGMGGEAQGQPAAGQTQIPIAAVEMLKKDPKMAAAFDAKYGAGASAKYLGK